MQPTGATREPAAQGLAREVRSLASTERRRGTEFSHDLLDYYELGRKKPCGRGEPDGGGPVGVLHSVAGVWSGPRIELRY